MSDPTYRIEPGYDLPGMDDGVAIYRTIDGDEECIAVVTTEYAAERYIELMDDSEPPPISTPEGKIRFLKDLTQTVLESIIETVPRMPDTWDGHELRQLLADKFENETTALMSAQHRIKSFRNDCRNNNL